MMPTPGSELKGWGKLEAYWPDENLRAKAHINNGPHRVIVPAEFLSCSATAAVSNPAAAHVKHEVSA
jgi:hypothetical protein